jgi:hypothetical protein
LNIQNQIADFLSLLNPFKGTMDFFKSDEELMQDSKDNFQIFGTMWDGTKKLFNGIMNIFKPPEAKAGTLDEFLKDGGVLPDNTTKNFKEVRKNLMNLSDSFTMSEDGEVDFTSLGATKGKEMEDIMNSFLGVVKTEFLPLTEDDKLESIASSFMNSSLKTPIITKKSLDAAPEFVQDIF